MYLMKKKYRKPVINETVVKNTNEIAISRADGRWCYHLLSFILPALRWQYL